MTGSFVRCLVESLAAPWLQAGINSREPTPLKPLHGVTRAPTSRNFSSPMRLRRAEPRRCPLRAADAVAQGVGWIHPAGRRFAERQEVTELLALVRISTTDGTGRGDLALEATVWDQLPQAGGRLKPAIAKRPRPLPFPSWEGGLGRRVSQEGYAASAPAWRTARAVPISDPPRPFCPCPPALQGEHRAQPRSVPRP
jgi:hypothetical protein